MKKTVIFRFLAFAALVLSASCVAERMPASEQRETNQQPLGKMITITASLEQGLTKSSLTESLDVVWNEGDQIRVFNAQNPDGVVFTLDAASAGKVQGAFSGPELSGDAPYYALYPASLQGTLEGTAIQFNFPAEQTANGAENFGLGANISVGMAAAIEEIYFRNVCGVLAITLSGEQSISQLSIMADAGDYLSGPCSVTPSMTSAPSLMWGSYGSQSQKLSLSSPVVLNPEGTTFYMVVPAGSLAKGFALEVRDSANGVMVKRGKDDNTNQIQRSTIRPMPALEYVPAYNADWLDNDSYGAFTNVQAGGSTSLLLAWDELAGQLVWNDRDNWPRTFRFQDWEAGYSVGITVQTDFLVAGKSYSAKIKALGATNGLTSYETTLKVVKRNGARVWLSDGTNGFNIITMDY